MASRTRFGAVPVGRRDRGARPARSGWCAPAGRALALIGASVALVYLGGAVSPSAVDQLKRWLPFDDYLARTRTLAIAALCPGDPRGDRPAPGGRRCAAARAAHGGRADCGRGASPRAVQRSTRCSARSRSSSQSRCRSCPSATARVDIATLVLTYVMLGWGLNIVVGLAGLLDLGYVAFYAVGAYSYATVRHEVGLSFWAVPADRGADVGLVRRLARLPGAAAARRLSRHRHARVRRDGPHHSDQLVVVHRRPNGINDMPRPILLRGSVRAQPGRGRGFVPRHARDRLSRRSTG